MNSPAFIRRSLATILITLWWGGFTFYAGRVVFIGHDVLGSTTQQGFITERVTTELNVLAMATTVMVGWELFSLTAIKCRKSTLTAWVLTLACTIALIFLHVKLSGMLNIPDRRVVDGAHFYGLHRVYLLTATVQWAAGGALLLLFQNALLSESHSTSRANS